MKLAYNNLTISGGVAVGKNTLKDNLRPYLAPLGWRFASTGQIIRDFTKEHIHPVASLAPADFHRRLDQYTRQLLTIKKHYVIESWLAGFFARDLADTLRVLLICSDKNLLAKRVAKRDKVSLKQAEKFITERKEINFAEWQKLYGQFDFFNPAFYQLTIDTAVSTPEYMLKQVLTKLGYNT